MTKLPQVKNGYVKRTSTRQSQVNTETTATTTTTTKYRVRVAFANYRRLDNNYKKEKLMYIERTSNIPPLQQHKTVDTKQQSWL